MKVPSDESGTALPPPAQDTNAFQEQSLIKTPQATEQLTLPEEAKGIAPAGWDQSLAIAKSDFQNGTVKTLTAWAEDAYDSRLLDKSGGVKLTAKEANTMYEGMSFTSDIHPEIARRKYQAHISRLQNQEYISRGGDVSLLRSLGIGILASVADPLNYMAGMGVGRIATTLGKGGMAAEAIAKRGWVKPGWGIKPSLKASSIENAIGNLAVDVPITTMKETGGEKVDYLNTIIVSLGTGVGITVASKVIGHGLSEGYGAAKNMSKSERTQAFGTALKQTLINKKVSIDATMNAYKERIKGAIPKDAPLPKSEGLGGVFVPIDGNRNNVEFNDLVEGTHSSESFDDAHSVAVDPSDIAHGSVARVYQDPELKYKRFDTPVVDESNTEFVDSLSSNFPEEFGPIFDDMTPDTTMRELLVSLHAQADELSMGKDEVKALISKAASEADIDGFSEVSLLGQKRHITLDHSKLKVGEVIDAVPERIPQTSEKDLFDQAEQTMRPESSVHYNEQVQENLRTLESELTTYGSKEAKIEQDMEASADRVLNAELEASKVNADGEPVSGDKKLENELKGIKEGSKAEVSEGKSVAAMIDCAMKGMT